MRRKTSRLNEKMNKYQMILILKAFRNGLYISQETICNALIVSHNRLCCCEKGKVEMNVELLKEYSNLIAEWMEFDKVIFYHLLKKEAESLKDESQNSIIRVMAKIIETDILQELHIEPVDGVQTVKIENRMMVVLGCLRRILEIKAPEIKEGIGINSAYLSQRESNKRNSTQKIVHDYANYLAKKLEVCPEIFLDRLEREAMQMTDFQLENTKYVLKVLARIVNSVSI